ncbi:MAG: hypothetical protein GY757_55975, partial [bacterium]|nr:hypothetical protein [bacterium]
LDHTPPEPAALLPEIPPHLNSLLLKMIEKAPTDRLPAKEVLEKLKALKRVTGNVMSSTSKLSTWNEAVSSRQ